VEMPEIVESFRMICDGEVDHIPEQAFFNVGGLEDVYRAWDKMKKGN